MELQQMERLLFLFVGLVFVILAALVVYVVVANRRHRARISRAHRHDEVDLRPTRHVAGQVVALVREEAGDPLEVEISGTRYRSLTDIEDLQIRQRVVEAAMELIRFTGVLGEGISAPAPLEKTYSWRQDLRESSQSELDRIQAAPVSEGAQPQPAPAPKEVEDRFLSLLAEMGQDRPQPETPTLASSIQHTLRPKLPESDRPPRFVDDIEEIVQRRIRLIPALQGRGLHIQQAPGGAVRFALEGQEYESVDDIPNLTARQLIEDAIQEWNDTM
jgi:hypothetical protein